MLKHVQLASEFLRNLGVEHQIIRKGKSIKISLPNTFNSHEPFTYCKSAPTKTIPELLQDLKHASGAAPSWKAITQRVPFSPLPKTLERKAKEKLKNGKFKTLFVTRKFKEKANERPEPETPKHTRFIVAAEISFKPARAKR